MVEIKSFVSSWFSSNVFVVLAEENFVVDAGMGMSSHVIDYVNENDLSIDRIILTHRHYDHTADALKLSNDLGAPLYASDIEAEPLRKGDDPTVIARSFGEKMPPLDVKDLDEDNYAGFDVLLTPGHTNGGICLYHPEEKILLSGDTVFADGGVGRTDLPSGNTKDLRDSLERLAEHDIESLYSGHGRVVERDADGQLQLALNALNYLF